MTKKNDNFTYIAIVAIVAIVAVSMLLAGSNTKTFVKQPTIQQASVASKDLVGEASSKWGCNNYPNRYYEDSCWCMYKQKTPKISYNNANVPKLEGKDCSATCEAWCNKMTADDFAS